MEVIGYKCFNNGLVTNYGDRLEVGKTYSADGDISYGKNGYHFCLNMEDTFRYFDTFNNEVEVAKVLGSGKIDSSFDDYNEYYDLYCAEHIQVLEVLSRAQIIEYGLKLHGPRAWRFVSTFCLSKEEIELFKDKFSKEYTTLLRIKYYQEIPKAKTRKL